MTQAAQAGVLFLLGVVVLMLGAIGAIAISWARRAKRLAQADARDGARAEAPSPLATA
jgi:Flp pilus assembly protein TadG